MIQRPRLFTRYEELLEIMGELESLAMDLKTITVLQHDEKKNRELNEACDDITRAYTRIMEVYDQTRYSVLDDDSQIHESKDISADDNSPIVDSPQDTRPKRPMTDFEKMMWGIDVNSLDFEIRSIFHEL